MTIINGMDVDELQGFRRLAARDAAQARQAPVVTARWLGGDASRVECGATSVEIGGQDNLNPMQTVLAALAACEVDVIATHAALMELEVTEVEIEATGHFDLRSYLGLDGAPGPRFQDVSYRARLRAPDATPEHLASLRQRCESSSPVTDPWCARYQ